MAAMISGVIFVTAFIVFLILSYFTFIKKVKINRNLLVKEKYKIVLLPGDDIGPEVIQEAIKILKILESKLDYL